MSQKSPLCCARLIGRVHAEKANLANLAKKAARADQKGHDMTRYRGLLTKARGELEDAKRALEDHEADHAGAAS